MRPLLVPGAHVLRRHDGSFQVGLDPRDAVVLPGTPAVAACLARLDGSPATGDDPTLAVLDRAGLLVDERALIPLVSAAGGAVEAASAAATVRRHGARAAELTTARAARPVEVTGFGHPCGATLVDRARELLAGAGLGPDDGDTAVAVLVGVGEPERERTDRWLRDQVPHLPVRLSEGRATVGPFVVPGETACLRCVDAHHTDADPTWPLLVRQYAAACRRPRADGAPEPLDPLLAGIALAWAARDVATFVDGGQPSTWSTTLTLDASLAAVETRTWARHPECGCSWQGSAAV